MQLFIAIVGAVFAIFSIIILHELGHFTVARLCGIRVIRFSVGFGKALWKHVSKKTGIEYVLAVLPLGGYVKMLGEGEETTLPEEAAHSYNCKPLWQRMVVVLAGPFVNFVLAILAFYAAYLMGTVHIKPIVGRVTPNSIVAKAGVKPGDEIVKVGNVTTKNWQQVLLAVVQKTGDHGQLPLTVKRKNATKLEIRQLNLANWHLDQRTPEFLESLGLSPYQPKFVPIIGEVLPASPAKKAGMRKGDIILAINGRKVADWVALQKWVHKHPNQFAIFTVQRGKLRKNFKVQLGTQHIDAQVQGHIGVMVQPPKIPANMIHHEHFNLLSAWVPAVKQTWVLFKLNVIVTAKLITGKVSVKSLGGPVTIFRAAGQATQLGWQVYLGFIAFISLTIGYLNLLPIPGLDGGHFLFQLIEGLIGRPIPEKVQTIGLSIGMIFLVFLMVQATINDLLRLF